MDHHLRIQEPMISQTVGCAVPRGDISAQSEQQGVGEIVLCVTRRPNHDGLEVRSMDRVCLAATGFRFCLCPTVHPGIRSLVIGMVLTSR